MGLNTVASVVAVCLLVVCAHASTVQISNQKFFVNGEEFFIKGMVYQPTPLGIQSMDPTGYGGGGYCSAKMTPYGEWKSACYDYDFFDGSSASPGRVPAGPSSWFANVWARDLPVLQDLGVNTIKLLSLNPLTYQASSNDIGTNDIKFAYGKNHVPFMDACASAGIKVIAPLVNPSDPGALLSENTTTWQTGVSNLLEEIGSHSALLAWYVGSDWGVETNTGEAIATAVNAVFDYARAQGAKVPLTYCTSNLPDSAAFYVNNMKMDFVCANAGWTGPNGIASFVGNASTSTSWTAQSAKKGWPILIGEAGIANLNSTESSIDPTWFNELWKQTVDLSTNGVVGSVFFEYNDEPYSGTDWQRSLGATTFTVAVDGINNSTQQNIFWTDTINEKPIVYEAIKNGTLSGVEMNYNMNVFTYLGRKPVVIHSTPSDASSQYSNTSIILNLCVWALALLAYAL